MCCSQSVCICISVRRRFNQQSIWFAYHFSLAGWHHQRKPNKIRSKFQIYSTLWMHKISHWRFPWRKWNAWPNSPMGCMYAVCRTLYNVYSLHIFVNLSFKHLPSGIVVIFQQFHRACCPACCCCACSKCNFLFCIHTHRRADTQPWTVASSSSLHCSMVCKSYTNRFVSVIGFNRLHEKFQLE